MVEERKGRLEAAEQCARRKVTGAGGGQLDRERKAIQSATDLRDGVEVAPTRDLSAGRAGTLKKQCGRWIGCERRHDDDALPLEAKRLAARDQHAQARTPGDKGCDQRSGVDDLLEIVDDQEQLTVTQCSDHCLLQ